MRQNFRILPDIRVARPENGPTERLFMTGDQKYEITTTYNSLNDANAATVRERFLAISGNKYYGNVTVAAGSGFKSSAFATSGNKKTI